MFVNDCYMYTITEENKHHVHDCTSNPGTLKHVDDKTVTLSITIMNILHKIHHNSHNKCVCENNFETLSFMNLVVRQSVLML